MDDSPEMEILNTLAGKTIRRMSITREGRWLTVWIDFEDGTCTEISSERGSWPEIIHGKVVTFRDWTYSVGDEIVDHRKQGDGHEVNRGLGQ